MIPRPEIELLLLCARSRQSEAGAARVVHLLGAGIDWDAFFALSLRHGVVPLVHRRLSTCFSQYVPEDELNRFRAGYMQNAARNLFLTSELCRILQLFESQGIQAIPYKGPSLAVAAYGDVTLRKFLDLDIIVRPRDVRRATELLRGEGFSPHFELRGAREEDAFLRLSYVQLFTRSDPNIAVELHWNVAPRFYNFPLRVERLWDGDESLQLAGRRVRAIETELLLLLLCVHGNKDLWERLEWLCAIDALLSRTVELDWERLLSEARNHNSTRILLFSLALSKELLGTPLPARIRRKVEDDSALPALCAMVRHKMYEVKWAPAKLAEQLRLHLGSKETWRDRYIYCARLALTTTPVDWAAVSIPPSYSFVHLMIRPFRLLKKHFLSPVRRAS